MAQKRNTITLEVLLNEKDIAKKLAAAFEGSPKAVAAIAKAVSPLEKGLDRVLARQKAINTALRAGVKITADIAKNYDAISGKAKGISEETRALGALSKLSSATGQQARAALAASAKANQAAASNPNSTGRGAASNQALQAQAQLANATLKQKENEERLTKELENQVRAHIAIAKAQRANSPASAERLIAYEAELTDLVNDRSNALEKQGRFASLLLKVEGQLTEETTRGAKAERARVEERRKEFKLISDLKARESALNAERSLQRNIRSSADDSPEGRASKSAALTSEVALNNDILRVRKEIEAVTRKTAAAADQKRRAELATSNKEFDRLIKTSGERNKKGLQAFSEVLRLEGQYEDQLKETNIELEKEIRLLDRLKKIRSVIADKAKDPGIEKIRQEELRDRVQSRISGSQTGRVDSTRAREDLVKLQRELNDFELDAADGSKLQIQYGRLLLAVKKEIESIDRAAINLQKESSSQIREDIKLLTLRAKIEGADGKRAVEQLILVQDAYIQKIEQGVKGTKEEIELRVRLAEVQRGINAANSGNTGKGGNIQKQQLAALNNYEAILKAKPGGVKSDETFAAFNAVREAADRLEKKILQLDQSTQEYFDTAKVLARAKSILDSGAAKDVEKQTDAYRDLAAELKEAIRLSALGGEEGKAYAAKVEALAAQARDDRIREKNAIEDIGQQLLAINNIRESGVALTQDQLETEIRLNRELEEAQKNLRAAQDLSAEVNKQVRRGTSRAALKANRRERGFDSYSALVDIGRVAQDAPYGFEGVANNIGPLIESMSLFYERVQIGTKGVGTLRTAIKSLAKDLLFTPIGIVALFNIIVLIVKAMPAIVEGIKKIADGFENAATVAEKFKKEIAEESSKEFGKLISEGDVAETQTNVDQILEKIAELRSAQVGGQDTTENGAFYNSLLLLDVKISETGAKLRDFFSIATDGDNEIIKNAKSIAELDAVLGSSTQSLIEAEAQANAFIQALDSNQTEAFTNRLEQQQDRIRKAELQTSLEGARSKEEKVRITIALFELETKEQRRQLEIQLKNEQVARAKLLAALRVRFAAIRASGQEITRSQLRGAADGLQAYDDVIESLEDSLGSFDNARAGALQNSIDGIEKVKDKTDELAKATRDALRAIIDVRREVETITNQNNNSLESQQFAQRKNQLEIDARYREIDRRRAQEDFAEQVKDLKNRGSLIAQFNAQQANLIAAQNRQASIERKKIDAEEAEYIVNQQQRVYDQALNLSIRNLGNVFGDRRETAEFDLQYRRDTIELQKEINALERKQGADFTPIDREVVKLLRDELLAREKVYGIESDQLDLRQRLAKEQRRADATASLTALKNNIENLGLADIFDGETRARRQAEVTLRQVTAEIEEEKRRVEREIELIQDKEERDARTEELEQQSLQRRKLAWEEYYRSLKDLQHTFFSDQQQALIDFGLQQLSIIENTANLLYSNSQTRQRNELELQGKSEEEITEILDKSSAKRRKIANTIAKANIVASTAVAAQQAFEGTLTSLKFLGPLAFPAALAAAGTAIAFGKAQYDAVGLDSIRSNSVSGGGSNSYTVGLDTAPGVQFTDPFSTADPFYTGTRPGEIVVVNGMAEMSNRIDELGQNVIASAEKIAERPAYVGYTPDAAAAFVRAGNDRDQLLTR